MAHESCERDGVRGLVTGNGEKWPQDTYEVESVPWLGVSDGIGAYQNNQHVYRVQGEGESGE